MQPPIRIYVNDEPPEVPGDLTAAGLIERLELAGRRLALEVNEEIVPRSRLDSHRLNAGDRVEIVHAIGGG